MLRWSGTFQSNNFNFSRYLQHLKFCLRNTYGTLGSEVSVQPILEFHWNDPMSTEQTLENETIRCPLAERLLSRSGLLQIQFPVSLWTTHPNKTAMRGQTCLSESWRRVRGFFLSPLTFAYVQC